MEWNYNHRHGLMHVFQFLAGAESRIPKILRFYGLAIGFLCYYVCKWCSWI